MNGVETDVKKPTEATKVSVPRLLRALASGQPFSKDVRQSLRGKVFVKDGEGKPQLQARQKPIDLSSGQYSVR